MNQKELLQKVLDASKLIDKSSRNSSGNYIITSKEVSNTITYSTWIQNNLNMI